MEKLRIKELVQILQKLNPQSYELNVSALVIPDSFSEQQIVALTNIDQALKVVNDFSEIDRERVVIVKESNFKEMPKIWSAVYPIREEDLLYVK